MNQPPTFTDAMLRDEYTCSLCGYSTMKHIVTAYANSPTGLFCPTDKRVEEKYRMPTKPQPGAPEHGA